MYLSSWASSWGHPTMCRNRGKMSEEVLKENSVSQKDDDSKYLPENPWISAVPTMLAVFIYVLDGTIANVALPHMAGSFSATRDESIWI